MIRSHARLDLLFDDFVITLTLLVKYDILNLTHKG